MFDVDFVASVLPPAVINIDNASIRLYSLVAPHILSDRKRLLDTIGEHYKQQTLTQVYRILGSSDIIGNPLGVVSSLQVGVTDFLSLPMKGIRERSPAGFLRGVGSGR